MLSQNITLFRNCIVWTELYCLFATLCHYLKEIGFSLQFFPITNSISKMRISNDAITDLLFLNLTSHGPIGLSSWEILLMPPFLLLHVCNYPLTLYPHYFQVRAYHLKVNMKQPYNFSNQSYNGIIQVFDDCKSGI
jgi:hypothetical protein